MVGGRQRCLERELNKGKSFRALKMGWYVRAMGGEQEGAWSDLIVR